MSTSLDRDGEADYLRLLGERIREARARRGMTRKILARDSAVSERYLAQLETGHGNISIILLRQIAQAMGLPLADIVRDGPERPVELALLLQTLERLSPAELTQARHVLANAFGAAMEEDRRHRIALIGLRGAGKSTLGPVAHDVGERQSHRLGDLAQQDDRDVAVAGLELGEVALRDGAVARQDLARHPAPRPCLANALAEEAQIISLAVFAQAGAHA